MSAHVKILSMISVLWQVFITSFVFFLVTGHPAESTREIALGSVSSCPMLNGRIKDDE